jgi:hypothetical protein
MTTIRATLGVLATLLLAGCAAAEPTPAAPSSAPSASSEDLQAESSEEAFIAKATKGEVGVAVIDVIDPRTFLVGPNKIQQDQNGFTGKLTAEIADDSAFVSPGATECGFDESLAFAKQYFAEHPENAFVSGGTFSSNEYSMESIRAGFAYNSDAEGIFVNAHEDAKIQKAGLWASCPGFGA